MIKLNEILKSDIKKTIEIVQFAPSVKYWMEPEFDAESGKYPQKGKPNSFIKTNTSGTLTGKKKWKADDVIAYDEKGKIVGVFSMATAGNTIGAFKISVREDSLRKGWGSKLLNYAENHGMDIISNLKNNRFSTSGRELLINWLKRKLK